MHTRLRSLLALALILSSAPAWAEDAAKPTTPIEHLIVIVGENLSFDHLFATFRPAPGETIANLFAKGIVTAEGEPGPNFARAAQQMAEVKGRYQITPQITGPFLVLPQPNTNSARGLPLYTADARFPTQLPNGPFQITRSVAYGAYVGDPIHRFFQMWQQLDGGRNDLFVWVGLTSGEGAENHDDPGADTRQGGLAMGFYNMAMGDAPYLRQLAERYAIADNYHQPIMGGTGINYFALATGDVPAYLVDGQAATPPANQIENPDPRPGSNNRYTQSGYFSGSYANCADPQQPGIGAIRDYLRSLPYKAFRDGNCAPGHYYLLNNYRPGYTPDGQARPLGPERSVLPPQVAPTMAEALAAKGVSWKWYSGGRIGGGIDQQQYCDLCDALTHSTVVMMSALKANLQGIDALERDLTEHTLPAVAFIVPPNAKSGHPAYSTAALFEDFLREILPKMEAQKDIWAKAAILITTDEGGGYYDSGYVQPLDFFGDGTRIALIAVSPFAKKGHVEHTYYDHVSILKFIERNWHLPPLSSRSRDNLPNPVMSAADPYVPENRPAIGDLMELFQF